MDELKKKYLHRKRKDGERSLGRGLDDEQGTDRKSPPTKERQTESRTMSACGLTAVEITAEHTRCFTNGWLVLGRNNHDRASERWISAGLGWEGGAPVNGDVFLVFSYNDVT